MIISHCGISVVINVRLYDSPDACAQENLSGVLHYQPVHVFRNGFRVRQSAEVREKCSLRLKYGSFFLTKLHGFATGGLYSRPGAVTSWGLLKKHPPIAIIMFGIAKTIFLPNSDWIRLNEESHIHLGCLEGE